MKKVLYTIFIFALFFTGMSEVKADTVSELESIDAVSSATATTQFKEEYIVGEFLDYQVFTVQLNYSDGTHERISYPDFKANGISINPANGKEMKEVRDIEITFEKDGIIGSKTIKVTKKQFKVELLEYSKDENVILYAVDGDYWYPLEMNGFKMEIAKSAEDLELGKGTTLKRKTDYNLASASETKGSITILNKTIAEEGEYYVRLSESSYDSKIFKIVVDAEGNIVVEEVKNSFNITFETNGGEVIEGQELKKGEKVTKPEDPKKEGFDFKGWFLDEEGKNEFNFDTLVAEDIKLYAIWEETIKPAAGKNITLIGGKGTLTENIEISLKDFKLTRIAGISRYETLSEVSKLYNSSSTVVIASGEQYTDKLTATILANSLEAPILLSKQDSLPDTVKLEIGRLEAKNIIIVGGTGTISKNVEKQLGKYNIERLGGINRYETAVLVGDKVRTLSSNKTEVVLVDGNNFPDAIAISSLAAQSKWPILLTDSSILNKNTESAIKNWNISKVTIGGGTGSVSESIENNLKKTTSVDRIAGIDRYETAVKIAEKTYPNPENIVIASGENYPDAIVGANYSAKNKYPIILTKGNSIPEVAMNYINK